MGTLMSIRPPYTNMIFNGEKPFEFRNKIIGTVREDETIYIYETKRNNGCGKVIGECKVKRIYDELMGTADLNMALFAYFRKIHNIKEREKERKEKQKEKFSSWAWPEVYHIPTERERYIEWLTNNPLDPIGRDNKRYKDEFDNWRDKIGYYYYFRYAIELKDVVRYETPKELTDFIGSKGMPIERAPQSMCKAKSA